MCVEDVAKTVASGFGVMLLLAKLKWKLSSCASSLWNLEAIIYDFYPEGTCLQCLTAYRLIRIQLSHATIMFRDIVKLSLTKSADPCCEDL